MNVTLEKPRPKGPPEPGFWNGELGYPHALVVVITAFLIGVFYHTQMPWGVNIRPGIAWTGGLTATALVAFVTLRWRNNRLVEWITGIPFAIVSTVAVCLVAGVGAVVPAETLNAKYKIVSIYSSWPFVMVMLTMVVNLIGVSARRCYPLTYRNLCFSLNHFGLTIAILGGALSAASLDRVRIELHQGQATNAAVDIDGKPRQVPFTTTLNEFTLDTFPPVLVVARMDQSAPDGIGKVIYGEKLAKAGATETIDGYKVKILEYHPRAVMMGNVVRATPDLKGAPPFVRVEVTDPAGHQVKFLDAGGKQTPSVWVNSSGVVPMGGHAIPVEGAPVQIAQDRLLGMPPPSPRAYRSSVVIEHNGKKETREIRVNEPLSVGGYRLYQVSYDEQMGAASTVSVIEAVRDTGLPVVYAGLYLMIAGAVLMLWNGVGTGATVSSPTLPVEKKAQSVKEVTA